MQHAHSGFGKVSKEILYPLTGNSFSNQPGPCFLVFQNSTNHTRNHVDEFKPQECANCIWALANLTFNDTELIRGIAVRAAGILHEFRNQNLSNFIWAFAKLRQQDVETTLKILQVSLERLTTFSPQDSLMCFCHALANLSRYTVLVYIKMQYLQQRLLRSTIDLCI